MYRVLPSLLVVAVWLCVGCDVTSPEDDSLPITAQQIDSVRAAIAPELDDAALAALALVRSPGPALATRLYQPGASLLRAANTDPTFVPDVVRGRRFDVFPPGMRVGVPDSTVPPNAIVMTLYRDFPLPYGDNRPAVGTLTIVDSTTFPTAIAVVTARNLAGRVVLRARLVDPLPGGEVFATGAFGGVTGAAATLTDSVFFFSGSARTSVALADRDVAVQSVTGQVSIDRVLFTRGQRVTVTRFLRAPFADSAAVSVNGRFVGAMIGTRGVVGSTTPAGADLVAATMRFFDAFPGYSLGLTLNHTLEWAKLSVGGTSLTNGHAGLAPPAIRAHIRGTCFPDDSACALRWSSNPRTTPSSSAPASPAAGPPRN